MLFTSYRFLLFFTSLFVLYWIFGRKSVKVQNGLLLVFSYLFYGIAEWRMLPLLIVATIVFYWLGIKIDKSNNIHSRKIFTHIGVLLGIGVLLYFKYFNFFIESFAYFFDTIGIHTNIHTFNILMPLGVSYFTFKLISYVLEGERWKMEATKNFVDFAVYVSFFPTIMAGPIDRPNKFIPQLQSPRVFSIESGIDGGQQIIWGLFKKVLIADNLSPIIDGVWENMSNYSGSTLVFALFLYTIQMYADFSGYSDMAIGVSKLLGIRIAKNFNYPFFATNIKEFWQRWHISLTGWLTDYVFTPLHIRFRDLGNFGMILAIIINMVLVGMWHGANWTYAVFGLYQGLLFIPIILKGKMHKKQKLQTTILGLPKFVDICKMFGVVCLYAIGIILFRAENLGQSWEMIRGICNLSIFSLPQILTHKVQWLLSVFFILVITEWYNRDREYAIQPLSYSLKSIIPYILIDYILLFFVIFKGNVGANSFIYFQF